MAIRSRLLDEDRRVIDMLETRHERVAQETYDREGRLIKVHLGHEELEGFFDHFRYGGRGWRDREDGHSLKLWIIAHYA